MKPGKQYSVGALEEVLRGFPVEGRTAEYAVEMWRLTLRHWQRRVAGEEPARDEGLGALPYVPVDPATLGLALTEESQVVDLGCLGGYGLFDFARHRKAAGEPVPALTGVDVDAQSVALGRAMAKVWAEDLDVTFLQVDSADLPFAPAHADLVMARLLLPYVRVVPTLREIARVLKPAGVGCIQLHGFGYYARQVLRRGGSLRGRFYYLRPVLAGAWFRLTRRQPRNRWFSEMAMTHGSLVRLARRCGLQCIWRGEPSPRPLLALRKETRIE